ncbi:hypothetical protein [Zoogloea sp.]|uniref:hypothetical protein n=1 Tax=Zoogloea sp. TaxID=49181 RepID=UPI00262A8226|nr:hypothetical protein [Zoogloea sp.]
MATYQSLGWPDVDPELLKGLPPIHRAVVRALGIGPATRFLTEYGGVNQHIPKRKARAFGLSEAEFARLREALARHTDATGRCPIPKVDKIYRQARDAQIRADHARQSLRGLAREHYLTSRQVQNIVRDEDQLSLF